MLNLGALHGVFKLSIILSIIALIIAIYSLIDKKRRDRIIDKRYEELISSINLVAKNGKV